MTLNLLSKANCWWISVEYFSASRQERSWATNAVEGQRCCTHGLRKQPRFCALATALARLSHTFHRGHRPRGRDCWLWTKSRTCRKRSGDVRWGAPSAGSPPAGTSAGRTGTGWAAAGRFCAVLTPVPGGAIDAGHSAAEAKAVDVPWPRVPFSPASPAPTAGPHEAAAAITSARRLDRRGKRNPTAGKTSRRLPPAAALPGRCRGAGPGRGGAASTKRGGAKGGPARLGLPAVVSRERQARAAGRAAALARAAAPDPTWRKVRGGARAGRRPPPAAPGAPAAGVVFAPAGDRGQLLCRAAVAAVCETGSALPAVAGAGRPPGWMWNGGEGLCPARGRGLTPPGLERARHGRLGPPGEGFLGWLWLRTRCG